MNGGSLIFISPIIIFVCVERVFMYIILGFLQQGDYIENVIIFMFEREINVLINLIG